MLHVVLVLATISAVCGVPLQENGTQVVIDQNITGYLYEAENDDGVANGVVLLQEWWGVTEEIKQQAMYIAEQGYEVLIPDLYKGEIGVDREEASHLRSKLNWTIALGEIEAAAQYLKDSGSPEVAVVGFCMGGALAISALQTSPDIVAAATFYGIPGEISNITKPVLGQFGQLDENKGFSDPESAKELEKKLANGTVIIYPGVGHAFMNDDPKSLQLTPNETVSTSFPGAVKEVQDEAWMRLFQFFDGVFQTS